MLCDSENVCFILGTENQQEGNLKSGIKVFEFHNVRYLSYCYQHGSQQPIYLLS